MITIYHNPRCAKSRQGVAFLKEHGVEFKEQKYLDAGLRLNELESIIKKLKIKPIELIRKSEAIWKSNYKGKTLSDNAILSAMVAHPKLMERPIILNNNKAVIGRPTENILKIL